MKVIVSAAGTGGHINPAIAIANKIKQEEKNSKIMFIGTTRGLENDLVPRAGYELKHIEAYGINRKISINNIKNLFKTIKGFNEAKKIMKEYKPDVIIGTGGYICGPVIMAANKYKIPSLLHESNAFPGIAVKFLSSKVNEVLVGFEDAKARLPKAKKVVLTGTPTKVKKLNISLEQKNKLIEDLNLISELPIVLVFGGSQGAKSINNSLIEIIQEKKNKNFQIIWATGQSQYDVVKQELKKLKLNVDKIQNFKILPYIYNMDEIMNISDIIICRSGAMTITEVSKMGKPAIFIPFPFATENHQEYNAKVLEKVGAARIILDRDLTADKIVSNLDSMLEDKRVLKEMGEKAEKISVNNVEQKIYEEIKNVLAKEGKNG